ncbi:unnamed protein product [Vitrella brassicaformis CCMP3155]|uniref:ER membrane protein complex subunit 6 n=2 Tax=Vitrella brassicaformis TaxID=1169539 RepID=A0A0G4ERR0_VITBC|nr:unnamed protein product [Vitrella brassicaformis CCMP3155]|mmetsp:Transcript_18704/g.53604  ORF Transcript_18704/g.53604 Transcript_18704/m.53604 type:complete len:112 (-) Transcript_18704:258-593(-)|eukprot:CEM00572.1 unnamed protein product [Vitrella brassicaformis CCMP3155]
MAVKKDRRFFDEQLIIESMLGHNRRVVAHCRNFAAIVSGLAAGILGLTGLWGLLVFVMATLGISLILLARVNFDTSLYFPTVKEVLIGQFWHGMMSFILFWTLAYDMVYIF